MFEDTNTAYALDSKIIIPNSLDFILNRLIFSFNYFNNIFQIMFIDVSRINMTNLFKKRLSSLYITLKNESCYGTAKMFIQSNSYFIQQNCNG